MFEVDTGGDESADLVLNILKAVGVPERSDGQTCSRMRVEDDALTFLHARAFHESLDVIGQFDNIVEFRLNIEFFQLDFHDDSLTLRFRCCSYGLQKHPRQTASGCGSHGCTAHRTYC